MLFKRLLTPIIVLIGLLFVLQLSSCRYDELDPSPSLQLEFSTDSLLFDTVFTTVGSSTRLFKVYNPNNSRIRISDIELAGGVSSYFRINADGRSGTVINNIEVGARDSIFVFVEVTVDPLGQDLPLVIADSVVFRMNDRVQNVKLVAWGQDAHFITPNYMVDSLRNFVAHVIWEDELWSGQKPYVIYGAMLVAPGVTFTIDKGTSVHLHNNGAIAVYPDASLRIKGTLEEPVTIQGDRMEAGYRDLPGQWGFIWLLPTSRDHLIEHAIIKNGTYGIIMDSIGSFTDPTLTIRNSVIKNMDHTGLELNGAWTEISNTVVANCAKHAIVMQWGGRHDLRHVTVANYYSLPGPVRQTPSVVINNYYLDANRRPIVRDIDQIYIANSIIYGSLQEEISIDLFPENTVIDLRIDHSLVRTTLQLTRPGYFATSLYNQMPRFINVSENDYRLLENSPAIGKGNPAAAIPFDIMGNSRQDRVDMGAYQFYEIEEEP